MRRLSHPNEKLATTMNKPIKLSSQSARNLVIRAQFPIVKSASFDNKEAVYQIINQLGYIQIDTISVVNRSHHQTLWTRYSDYHESMLHDLQAIDRAIFEYWGHAMSYLPMSDYRFVLPRMKKLENPKSYWFVQQFEKCGHLLEPVLERIQKEGPLSSKDFAAPKHKSGNWWDWKPAKCALEMLFWKGDLMIAERNKFQKVYDLRERVLPADIDTTLPSDEEAGRFLVRRALQAMGIANEKEIQRFMQPEAGRDSDLRITTKDVIRKSISDLVDANEIVPVHLEDVSSSNDYMFSKALEKERTLNSEVFFLSPFDNLIIQRDRLKRIFNFDYTLECYVPAAKRKHGYFVFPILWNDRLVGRLDPKADRKNKILIINNLIFESDFGEYDVFLPLFVKQLVKMTTFNGCKSIQIKQTEPRKIQKPLELLIRKIYS
ncbi:winged helix-turn-helix domain-containing protein [candidate division KSB1 bacterium]|nr:winged helix-turn-helix domain-containing protein [candidate division KSB1 bacterium]